MASIKTYAKPIWLYRYRSLGLSTDANIFANQQLQREVGALLNGYVYCSTYKKMNDPMEGLYHATSKATMHREYNSFVSQLKTEKLSIGIASFSETWDNELMWAHYADGFQGMCICYLMSDLINEITDEHSFSRIAYGNKPHHLNLSALKDEQDRARAVLSTKHLSWAYEREWRIFAPQPGPVRHGREAIKSVFLGARVLPKVRQAIEEMLSPLNIPVHVTKVEGYRVVKQRR